MGSRVKNPAKGFSVSGERLFQSAFHAEADESLHFEERADDLGNVIERVGEGRGIRIIAVSKTGIVRGDDMKLVGQGGDQMPILMRGGREAVQQDDLGATRGAGFSISNAYPIDLKISVGDGRCF
jgi:hypothetical protein